MARPKLPNDLTVSGERVLASARVVGVADPLLASTHALYIPATGDLDSMTRVAWTQIDRATWEDPEIVVEALIDGEARRWRIRVEEPGRVPEVVRERVTASIVFSEHVELLDGAGARIVGRRSGPDDQIEWSIAFDAGLDPQDKDLRGRAVAALAELRESLGI